VVFPAPGSPTIRTNLATRPYCITPRQIARHLAPVPPGGKAATTTTGTVCRQQIRPAVTGGA